MKAGKPVAFVIIAFLIGATISQGSFAFVDDSSTNPFRAIWDAIGELQTKTDTLQAQIDDLKAQQGTAVAASPVATKTSDGSVHVEVSGGESGQTIVTIFTRNSGPDSAVGAKLTVFYETSLLRVNFIEGADCSDGSRGIIECYLGTVEDGSDAIVTIDADPIILEQSSRIVAEFSSITRDANPADNHAELLFVTGIAPVAQPETSGGGSSSAEETPAEQVPEDTEPTTEETPEAGDEQTSQGTEQTEQQPTEETSDTGEEQTSEEQTEAGDESGSEQSADESTGEQSEDTGSSSTEEGTGDESGSDTGAGSEEGSAGDTGGEDTGGSDTGASDTGSESGDAGDSGSSESAGSDSGAGDSGSGSEESSSGDGGSSGGGGSEGGSSGDGSSSGDSGSEDGGSSGSDSGEGQAN